MQIKHEVINSKELSQVQTIIEIPECVAIANDDSNLSVLDDISLARWLKYPNFIIFGTGGSSLGGQAIYQLSSRKNLRFVCNLDSDSLIDLFSDLDVCNTGFLCISKSGETLETICQTLIAMEKVKSSGGTIGEQFVFITEDKDSSMKRLALEHGITCVDHPKTIGGRFSVFTPVGMLPAYMCGVDPREIYAGVRETLQQQFVREAIAFTTDCYRHNLRQQIFFCYGEKLIAFGKWLEQLYAESTGKCGQGITPILAVGSVDQHSQLQLYLDGPADKCFSFFLEKQTSSLSIDTDYFDYLRGKKVSDIFAAQYKGTLIALKEAGRFVRTIEFGDLTPRVLGGLFAHFMLEVIGVCRELSIDPFDQPAVEHGKNLTLKILRNCNAI